MVASASPPVSASSHIKDATTQSFAADVIEASKVQPVIVDFWAPWCGPCRQLTPLIEKVVSAAGGKVKLVKMNIDEHPAIPGQLGVQSLPTVIAFKNGQPVDAFAGALPESQIKQFVDSLGSAADAAPSTADILKAADTALAAGDAAGALQAYAAVLSMEPDNLKAIAGMAHCYIKAGEPEQARALVDALDDNKKEDAAVKSVLSALALAKKASAVGDFAAAEARVAQNPKDHQARYDLALAYAAQDKKSEAVAALLAIVAAQKDWNEAAAKKQLLQFFEAWGFDDDAAIEGRKKLSTLLFA